MHYRGSRGKEREKGIENVFEEIMAKEKNRYPVRGNTQGPKQVNPNRPTLRHIIMKMAKIKDKERIIKVAREKQNYIQWNLHKAIG